MGTFLVVLLSHNSSHPPSHHLGLLLVHNRHTLAVLAAVLLGQTHTWAWWLPLYRPTLLHTAILAAVFFRTDPYLGVVTPIVVSANMSRPHSAMSVSSPDGRGVIDVALLKGSGGTAGAPLNHSNMAVRYVVVGFLVLCYLSIRMHAGVCCCVRPQEG